LGGDVDVKNILPEIFFLYFRTQRHIWLQTGIFLPDVWQAFGITTA